MMIDPSEHSLVKLLRRFVLLLVHLLDETPDSTRPERRRRKNRGKAPITASHPRSSLYSCRSPRGEGIRFRTKFPDPAKQGSLLRLFLTIPAEHGPSTSIETFTFPAII